MQFANTLPSIQHECWLLAIYRQLLEAGAAGCFPPKMINAIQKYRKQNRWCCCEILKTSDNVNKNYNPFGFNTWKSDFVSKSGQISYGNILLRLANGVSVWMATSTECHWSGKLNSLNQSRNRMLVGRSKQIHVESRNIGRRGNMQFVLVVGGATYEADSCKCHGIPHGANRRPTIQCPFPCGRDAPTLPLPSI